LFADTAADFRRVFSYAGSKDDGIESAERDDKRAEFKASAIHELVDGFACHQTSRKR
jgi:hypothetical protein